MTLIQHLQIKLECFKNMNKYEITYLSKITIEATTNEAALNKAIKKGLVDVEKVIKVRKIPIK